MLANVVEEMLLSRERLRAEVAAVRRLARVPHYVVREVLLPRKRLTCMGGGSVRTEKTKNRRISIILRCETGIWWVSLATGSLFLSLFYGKHARAWDDSKMDDRFAIAAVIGGNNSTAINNGERCSPFGQLALPSPTGESLENASPFSPCGLPEKSHESLNRTPREDTRVRVAKTCDTKSRRLKVTSDAVNVHLYVYKCHVTCIYRRACLQLC